MLKKHLLSLFFLLMVATMAQAANFQTQWNIPANTTSITFNALTTGAVHYDLGTLASGTFTKTSAGPVTITFPPSSHNQATILELQPQNLRRFYMGSGTNTSQLTAVWAMGDVPWLSMAHMFEGCSNMDYLAGPAPNLAGVADMSYMFYGCSSMEGLNYFNTWNTSNVTNMSYMFYGATLFNQPIGNWNTANVTNMSEMFYNANAFNQPIGNWNTANVTDMQDMFQKAYSFGQPIGNWNTANVTNMAGMFLDAISFIQPIGNWNTGNVTNMRFMFYGATYFNQPIGSWNTANVTNMESMFDHATTFNQPIGDWNTGNVTNMSFMFEDATAFNQPIGDWNTGNVTNMSYMFQYSTNFNQPIGNWNTVKVTKMIGMFAYATSFNQPIGNWNTANVTNMTNMFTYATSFKQPIGNWNTANVTNMDNMFYHATSFNQNIGDWHLKSTVNLTHMLSYSGMDCDHYSATLVGWQHNNPTVTGRSLIANNRQYGTGAVTARTILINPIDQGGQGWTITGDSYSGTACDILLPIALIDFSAKNEDRDNILYWQTASELNNDYFIIEHSMDGTHFSSIGQLKGSGNTITAQHYSFVHEHVSNGIHYYRLRQVDYNGQYSYTPIVSVLVSKEDNTVNIYPNPARTEATIIAPHDDVVWISDMFGHIIMQQNIQKGATKISISGLAQGIYSFRFGSGDVIRVVVVK